MSYHYASSHTTQIVICAKTKILLLTEKLANLSLQGKIFTQKIAILDELPDNLQYLSMVLLMHFLSDPQLLKIEFN